MAELKINFGDQPFEYPPENGYVAVCKSSLGNVSDDSSEVLDVLAITEPRIPAQVKKLVDDTLKAKEISTSDLPVLCEKSRSHIPMGKRVEDTEEVLQNKEVKAGEDAGQPESVEVSDILQLMEPGIAVLIKQLINDSLQEGAISTSDLPELCEKTRKHIQMGNPQEDIEGMLSDAIVDVVQNKELKADEDAGQAASVEVSDVLRLMKPEMAVLFKQLINDTLQEGVISTSDLPELCEKSRKHIQMGEPLEDIEALLNDVIVEVIQNKEVKAGGDSGQRASVGSLNLTVDLKALRVLGQGIGIKKDRLWQLFPNAATACIPHKYRAPHYADKMAVVYVLFGHEAEASEALGNLNGRMFNGHKLKLEYPPKDELRQALKAQQETSAQDTQQITRV